MAQKTGLVKRGRPDFTQDYKMKIFTLWYNLGKPSPERLYSEIVTQDIKEGFSGAMPSKTTVYMWVTKDFEAKATFLDMEAAKSIEKQLVGQRIQMLNTHAKYGQELAEMGMAFLKENGLGNSRNALSAVIEGLRIEKESSGAPVKFTELSKLTDEELVGELQKIIEGSPILSIEPND